MYIIFSRIIETPEALEILEKYDNLMEKLSELDKELFDMWTESVPQQIEENLQQPLIRRSSKSNELFLNFHPQVKKKN